MYSNNLESVVFNRHLRSKADELLIITGYNGPDPFDKLKTLTLDCQVIYGMYGSDSIGEKLHKSLVKINSSLTNTDLF
ncbi:NgoFVII family restriction endonuclease, partial [Acinetobacter baumannii]|nr:NgoFVII family restriction endonuclease [Acinetobacter baumannii]